MKGAVVFLSVLCWIIFCLTVRAHEAHVHGVARVNLVVDGEQVTIGLESPLANLLSFEHAPVNLEQRRQVKDMARRMHQAESFFHLTPAAQCRLEKVSLASEQLDPARLDPTVPLGSREGEDGKASRGEGNKAGQAEHGDLDASFRFRCAQAAKLNSVDILLFDAWPKVQKIEVQAVTPGGQRAAGLSPAKHSFSW